MCSALCKTAPMTTAQQPTTATAQTCDICREQINAGERFHDDGDEIAHTACIAGWFHGNFGRESLR